VAGLLQQWPAQNPTRLGVVGSLDRHYPLFNASSNCIFEA
jgi:hypothetical protein